MNGSFDDYDSVLNQLLNEGTRQNEAPNDYLFKYYQVPEPKVNNQFDHHLEFYNEHNADVSPSYSSGSSPDTTLFHNTRFLQPAQYEMPELSHVTSSESAHSPNSLPEQIKEVKYQGKKVKSSHNLIEKKYRSNINTKIIELRNCVPSLRILISKSHHHHTSAVPSQKDEIFDDDYEGDGFTDDESKLDGLKPARKLNKATILSKAAEYIRHLEARNEILKKENQKLKSFQSYPRDQTSSFTQKMMFGGLGALAGASALDDFHVNSQPRSLFALPVLSFGEDNVMHSFLGIVKLVLVIAFVYSLVKDLAKEKTRTKVASFVRDPKTHLKDTLTVSTKQLNSDLSQTTSSSRLLTNVGKALFFSPLCTERLMLVSLHLAVLAKNSSGIQQMVYKKLAAFYWRKCSGSSAHCERFQKLLTHDFDSVYHMDLTVQDDVLEAVCKQLADKYLTDALCSAVENDLSTMTEGLQMSAELCVPNSMDRARCSILKSLKDHTALKASLDELKLLTEGRQNENVILMSRCALIGNLIKDGNFEETSTRVKNLDIPDVDSHSSLDLIGFVALWSLINGVPEQLLYQQADKDLRSTLRSIMAHLRMYVGRASVVEIAKRNEISEKLVSMMETMDRL